jgi:hypothetical protein
MPLMIREVLPNDALGAHLALEALGQVLPPPVVAAVLAREGAEERRGRKLPAAVTLLLCVAMHLFAQEALPAVFRRLVGGLRWLWPDRRALAASKSGICQARYRLGARPLVALFHQACRPLATPATPGGFRFGYRLMALDGTAFDLPDTPANVAVFGRRPTSRGHSAWPQVQVVGLCECATHALCDAGVWRYDADEEACARRLLRSVTADMLLLCDQGLYSFTTIAAILGRGAQVLVRVPAHVKPAVVAPLADGTLLVRIAPSDGKRRRRGEHLLLRLIRYTIDDPHRPGHRVEHRLLTSLRDPALAPAADLILAYHDRWEVELTVDEVVTHQLPARPLRSQKPVGVMQELYALFLAHYVVRAVMHQAASSADPPLPPTRLSFLESLRLIREALPDFQRTAARDHPVIYQALLTDIAAAKLPPRANRLNPRAVKQKMSNFPVKGPAHRPWPQPTKPFQDAIVLLI